MPESKKTAAKKNEAATEETAPAPAKASKPKLNKDGLEPNAPVTFEQMAAANAKRKAAQKG